MSNTTNTVSDEIDLFELLGRLWKSRLPIFAFIVTGLIAAALYAFTAKEEWTSKAQIIPPTAIQMGSYFEVQRAYYRFAGTDEKINVEESIKNAYTTLITMLNAADSKRDYLQGSAYFIQQGKQENGDVEKQKLLLSMVENDLQIEESNKGERSSYSVSFTAKTARSAQETLQGYVENINIRVLNKLFGDLHAQINERILSLENIASNLKQQTEQSRKNNMTELDQAIAVAKTANISEYTGQSTVVGSAIIDFSSSENMFLLGEKQLTAQLNALEVSPVIYPVAYFQSLGNINSLKQLLSVAPKGMLFEYTQTASLPVVKDKPKKNLILILGALLGGILGCCVVLVRIAIGKYVVKT